MAVSLSIEIKQNSQNVVNNTSNITVSLYAHYTNGSYNRLGPAGTLSIDGTLYKFNSDFNYYQLSSGTDLIFQKTVNVTHNTNGAKTVTCLATYITGVSSGKITATETKPLTTIGRTSTLSASNGMLNVEQNLSIIRKDSSFTHTIVYTCGSASGTICNRSGYTSIPWTPPIELASQNTTGPSVSIKFTVDTYSGSTYVGTTYKTISCEIPPSVAPSCSIRIADAAKMRDDESVTVFDTYGSMVKGLSKLYIEVHGTQAYESPIVSCKTVANGSTYMYNIVTTDVLKNSGTTTVSATVTDGRGRSGSASERIAVLDYTPPRLNRLSVNRCEKVPGTDDMYAENDQGKYIKVTFATSITRLDNKNTARYQLRYKRSSDSTYEVQDSADETSKLFKYNGMYDVTEGTFVFEADTGSSYNIEFTASDNHISSVKTTTASTAFTLMHWNTAGNGMGIGKVSELQHVLDVGMMTRHFGGIMHPVLDVETNIDEVKIPNTYIGGDVADYHYSGCPVNWGSFTLLVEEAGVSGQLRQTYMVTSLDCPKRFVRFYNGSSWGNWMYGTTEEVVLYESDLGSSGAITLAYSAANYTYLEIYYTDNNDIGFGYTKIWNPNGKLIHLQLQEPGANVFNRQTAYTINDRRISPHNDTASFIKFSPTNVVTSSFGTNYIKILRVVGLA